MKALELCNDELEVQKKKNALIAFMILFFFFYFTLEI